jgi:rRNA-processing protein FCF1
LLSRLTDSVLLLACLQIDLVRGMMDCLYAECIPCITDCVMAELEKLGPKYRVALKVAKVCVGRSHNGSHVDCHTG